jgi:LCP family protein required for cell wall assembly
MPGTPDHGEDHARSRADLQEDLRKSRKKEQRHKHRWRRRTLYALSIVVVLAAVGAGGLYFYADYRFDQIKKVHAKHLVRTAPVGNQQPLTLLLVGSDSRAFVDNATQVKAFGTEATAGGQRSDVTMAVRIDPKAKTVTILSIPRDLWVDIPGDVTDVSGMNRINAAFNSGPDLLVQTVEQDLGIAINHYASVGFQGFSGMVNALGGVTMDFPTQVKDQYTGLDVTSPGCQVVNGTTALQLVRSRHLYYKNSDGEWVYDGQSDFSRIQRQDAFFRAVLAKLNTTGLDPLTINAFLGAAVTNLTIDDTLTKTDLFNLAEDFKGLSSSHLVTETLPTTSFVTSGGADVLREAQPYAQSMINAFNAIGSTPPPTTTTTVAKGKAKGGKATTTTTIPTEAHSLVGVDVLNASTVNGIAHTTAVALTAQGFHIDEIGNAPTPISAGASSEILYGPSGAEAAHTLASVLGGPVTLVPDPSLTGERVSLLIAGSQLTVTGSSTGATTTTTTTTTEPTTTTIPGDVYTNTQTEPWNPSTCTLGQPTPTTPTTAAHEAIKKK